MQNPSETLQNTTTGGSDTSNSGFPVINFMGMRKVAAIASILLVLASIVSLATKGLNLGLDFSGGSLMELTYDRPAVVDDVRTELVNRGYDTAVVVHFGAESDVLVRVRDNLEQPDALEIASGLSAASGAEIELVRLEFVGPQVGEELREDGGLGLLAALIVVMLYVAVRFQYKFSVGAVAALFHDVIITLGLFSIFHWEFDLTVLAALLAVIGYSLNDTIVVFDRIRENFRGLRGKTPLEIANISLSQTLARTLVTSLTTLIVLIVLYMLGGEMINNFALALIIGVLIGTYSSIFVASTSVLALRIEGRDMIAPEETTSDDELPPEVPYR